MTGAGHDGQLRAGQSGAQGEGVPDRDLVLVVADHDQRRAGIAGEVGDGQGGLLTVHAVQFPGRTPDVPGPVRADRAVVFGEEGGGFLVQLDRAGRPPAVVEHPGGEHQPADQIGPLERDRRSVAVAEQVRGPTDDLVEEGDGVLGHQVVGDRPGHVGGAAVTAAVRPEDPEVRGEAGQVVLPGARVGHPGMQPHRRVAAAVRGPAPSGWPDGASR